MCNLFALTDYNTCSASIRRDRKQHTGIKMSFLFFFFFIFEADRRTISQDYAPFVLKMDIRGDLWWKWKDVCLSVIQEQGEGSKCNPRGNKARKSFGLKSFSVFSLKRQYILHVAFKSSSRC